MLRQLNDAVTALTSKGRNLVALFHWSRSQFPTCSIDLATSAYMNNSSAEMMERHKSLYFTDGNVVLLALRPDKSSLLFRVHKSVLSAHSQIFSDMFHVCDPSACTNENDEEQSYDGVPLIHLSDDPDHLGSLLQVLYYQSDLPWTPLSPHYPALIAPILGLSRKYGIDRVHAQIVRHLESDWPQTLNSWDKLEREIGLIMSGSEVERLDDYFPEPASAIKLAREFGVPSILPAIFYHLSRISILDDWDKTHADSSIKIQNPTKLTARWKLLSAKDFHCLLIGKAEIADFLRSYVNTSGLRHSSRDSTFRVGDGAKKDLLDKFLQPQEDPLAQLKSAIDRCGASQCTTCKQTVRDKFLAARAQIWENLGNFFHLNEC